MDSVGMTTHDHDRCRAERLATAHAYCATHRLQFTPVRQRVFEILLDEHKALGAYEILDRLKAEGFGSQPPVAYRTLDFLVKHRLVHRIERLNAYVACAHPCESHDPAFMICRLCNTVAETTSMPSRGSLRLAARATGFEIEQTVVEAIGLCPDCRTEGMAE